MAQTTPNRAKSRNASAFSPHVEPHNDGIGPSRAKSRHFAVQEMLRSNSAKAPVTWNINFPAGVPGHWPAPRRSGGHDETANASRCSLRTSKVLKDLIAFVVRAAQDEFTVAAIAIDAGSQRWSAATQRSRCGA